MQGCSQVVSKCQGSYVLNPRTLYERYTNFIDSSKVIVHHYRSKNFYSGQGQYLAKIQSWIDEEKEVNRPLVLQTTPGCGVKTIISQLQNYQCRSGIVPNSKQQQVQTMAPESQACIPMVSPINQGNKKKLLSILHFASNGSNHCNYYYSLHRIIIRLRESLKLKQNVDLLEENIRKFFAYWLDLVSEEVERQKVIYCAEDIYEKIVIVIQGVDRFVDPETGNQANVAFWLPQLFPKNVKVIVTAAKGSESLQHFQKKKCEIVPIKYSIEVASSIFKGKYAQKTILNPSTEKVYRQILQSLYGRLSVGNLSKCNFYALIQFYIEVFLIDQSRCKTVQVENTIKNLLQRKVELARKALSTLNTIEELYQYVIDMVSEGSEAKNKIELALIYLSMTQKGLTCKQLSLLTQMCDKQWHYFQSIFGSVMIEYEGIYMIKCTAFNAVAMAQDRLSQTDNRTEYHERIAKALDSTDNSIRKLQQQTYHLFAAKSYFKLKEMISNIQNFLLLFNPNNKYELSRYWQRLQEKGFDPVIEYNKAIEGFIMHYHPSEENTFRIIVQISKFLKEFCDFETYETPTFRHPYIEGNMAQLQKIGLLKQLSDLEIYIDNSFNRAEECDVNSQFTLEEQITELKLKYFPKEAMEIDSKIPISETLNQLVDFLGDFEKVNTGKVKRKSDNIKILSEIEQLNVDVPMNREKFRQHYLESLMEFLKCDQGYQQQKQARKETYLDLDQCSQVQLQSQAPQLSSNCSQSIGALSSNKIRESYRLRQIKPSLYYYKRWIWIQFPWVCISLNNNYSITPQLRKKIEGDDSDCVQLEAKYTKQALLVTIEAREKKRQMFSKKEDGDPVLTMSKNGLRISKSRPNMFTTSKFSLYKSVESALNSSKCLMKKSMVIGQLSLQSLTKELQMRRKKNGITRVLRPPMTAGVTQAKNNGFFLSQVCENSTDEEMKFLSLRKQFETPCITDIEPNEMLPKLKEAIKDHTLYELAYITRNISQKKKKLNKIIYENKKLCDIYQQLRVKENLSHSNQHQHENDKQSRKGKVLEDLLKRKSEVITDFCRSLLQKQRLKIILKLCSQNKTKNEEYLASLNYLVQNLKKMIGSEKESMKGIADELEEYKQISDKRSCLEAERERNNKIVAQEAQNHLKEKGRLEKQIEGIKAVICQDIREQKDRLENSLTGQLKNKEEKNQIKEQERTVKQLEERYERVAEEYKQLKELLELEGNDFTTSKKLKRLLEENQRNKKLMVTQFERRNKLQEVARELAKVKESYHKQSQQWLKQQMANEQKNKQNNSGSGKKNTDHRVTILLDNIALKLGVSDKNEIVNALKNKLDELKVENADKYGQVIGERRSAL